VDQARVVVIGGGVTGCSIAHHLVEAGWNDLVLLDKGPLTSGATSHAAGLVTAFNPSATMMRFRRYSIELYERLGVFERSGSLRIASSANQLLELERTASRARGIGLDVEVISPAEALERLPAMTGESLHGAVYLPGDGSLDPHATTHALAASARTGGARIRTGERVTAIRRDARGRVTAVETTGGTIACEVVVNAAGLWAPRVAAMVGAFIPSIPVDHQHVAVRAVAGSALPRDTPCFRDPDNLVYGRAEQGGMLFGGYETDPVSRWEDGVPWDHEARSLPPDFDRFAPLMDGAIRRFPFLADAEVVRLVCHPDAMTPDANPLLGPMPGVPGFWVAAGLSLNGFGGAGGIGRAIAGWITAGDPGVDIAPYRAWRFADTYRDPLYAAACARETYADYYRLRFPYDADEAGRPRRLSPVHGRLQDLGAAFGTKAGWERPDHLEPGRPWRRSGRDQSAYGFAEPPWFGAVAEEHRAVRERVGLVDLSSFGKIEVSGPGALALLQRVCANDVDREIGAVVYGQFLDPRGGMLADVTVTRLDADRFRVVTGAGYLAAELGWLRANLDPGDGPVVLRDVSEDEACLGLWGPRAREVLGAATGADVSDRALPLRRARPVGLAGGALAARISYVGELGWELYVPRERAVEAWDSLMAAGAPHGIRPIGYRALEGLRLEKGYRYYGTDLTSLELPDDAGLGAFVRPDKGPFVGREAVLAARASGEARPRLRTVVLSGPYRPVYGGEAVRLDGRVAGRLRSVAYGHTVGATVGTAYLPADVREGAALEIEVLGQAVAATVGPDVLVDPSGSRMRG
jgi:sarcosine dehydrogenase